ncbi:LOW QUALITY PROTEIN: ankyrin repeat and SOCS box protein 16 [Vanacampus margaritifer]
MSKDTFPFTSTSLRSLRLEQESQDWEEARRALAQRRALTRAPLPRAPCRPRPVPQHLQEVLAAPSQVRCRDAAIHNTFMYGDMKGVYAVLRDPAMANALMETVHEEMVWKMLKWTKCSSVKQTSAWRLAVNAYLGGSTTTLHEDTPHASNCYLTTEQTRNCWRTTETLLFTCTPRRNHNKKLPRLNCVIFAKTFVLTFWTWICHLWCVELLLKGGVDVNMSTARSKLTPLHVAAVQGLEGHVELLLSDVRATNRKHDTALIVACAKAKKPSEVGRYLGVVRECVFPSVPSVLQCVFYPATLEVIFNSYPNIQPCYWMDDGPPTQRHPDFFKLVRERSDQPRSLQHLCRCALRHHLLQNDGTLH